jgi:hypothetical protein
MDCCLWRDFQFHGLLLVEGFPISWIVACGWISYLKVYQLWFDFQYKQITTCWVDFQYKGLLGVTPIMRNIISSAAVLCLRHHNQVSIAFASRSVSFTVRKFIHILLHCFVVCSLIFLTSTLFNLCNFLILLVWFEIIRLSV